MVSALELEHVLCYVVWCGIVLCCAVLHRILLNVVAADLRAAFGLVSRTRERNSAGLSHVAVCNAGPGNTRRR